MSQLKNNVITKHLNVIENAEQKIIKKTVYYLNSDIGNEYFYGDIVLWKLRLKIFPIMKNLVNIDYYSGLMELLH
jgi:hypothetical protein